MMRTIPVLALALMLGAALAGCTSSTTPTPSTTSTTSTTTSTPSTTATTPATPTLSPPTAPTPPPVNFTATLGSVQVITAADRAASGVGASVCWRVEGTGRIPHTAIHWDTESHPNATAFSDYKGGAIYPGGGASADPKGYELPGVFCAPLPGGAGTLYYRAHALSPPNVPGNLSAERTLWTGASPTGIDFIGDMPELASATMTVTVCWQDDSIGHVAQTAIQWDTVSHANSTSSMDYAGGAAYPDNQTAATSVGYDTPGRFCTNLKMPASGQLYFRAHESNPPTSVDNISHERSIVVAPAVSIVSPPVVSVSHMEPGAYALVCWRVEMLGAATHVPHTAFHWDTVSHPGSDAKFSDYKGGAVYPDNATAASAAGYDLPGPYCANVILPASGPLYLRAHVLQPGVRNEVSDEIAIATS